MHRVITIQEDLCWHLARMMFDFYRRGYRMLPLWKRLERCLRWLAASLQAYQVVQTVQSDAAYLQGSHHHASV
jgi:hypothetical protein